MDSEHPDPAPKSAASPQPLSDKERWLNEQGLTEKEYEAKRAALQSPVLKQRRRRRVFILFIATCLSTFYVGMVAGAPMVFPPTLAKYVQKTDTTWSALIQSGLIYSAAVMCILLAHEMGHYLQARRYKVPASLPYFIPMPLIPFGTMGAVIVQGMRVVDGKPVVDSDRKMLFDIAVSGPLAGLVLALPIMWFGVVGSELTELDPKEQVMVYGDPLIVDWMITAAHGPHEGQEIQLTPLLFAGWVGIFVTALNLIPIGQLDGGHILYTLVGRKAHYISIGVLFGAIAYMALFKELSYILMAILLLVMGPKHPPTADDTVKLGAARVVIGWATLLFIIIGFTPVPLEQIEPEPQQQAQVERF